MSRTLAIALLALATGCVGSPGELPRQHYYRLPPSAPASAGANTLLPGTLGIFRPQASGLHHERAILYREAARPVELMPYHYHAWIDPPPLLVRDHLAEFLRASGAARGILREPERRAADYRLGGRLIALERVVNAQTIEVEAALELELRDASDELLLAPRVYRATVAATDRSMPATVEAFGEALERIYGEFLRDLAGAAERYAGRR